MKCSQSVPSPKPAAELAWAALRAVNTPTSPRFYDPAAALELASSLEPHPSLDCSPSRLLRRRRLQVAAGAVVEVMAGQVAGGPRLEPAPGSLPGLDERVADVSVYRVASAGRVGDRILPLGARILVGKRLAEKGDLLLIATRCSLRLVPADHVEGRLSEPRILGVVEGIVADAARH